MVPQTVTNYKPKRLRMGFTFIEMLIVICIIAVLWKVIVPGFKKAYSDFKISETYWRIDTLISAHHAFYLMLDEAPSFYSKYTASVEKRAEPFLPAGWLGTGDYDPYPSDPEKVFMKLKFYNSDWPYPYLFYYDWSRFGDFQTDLAQYTSDGARPYYTDELINRYKQRGYEVFDAPDGNENTHVYIYLPEGHEASWFR